MRPRRAAFSDAWAWANVVWALAYAVSCCTFVAAVLRHGEHAVAKRDELDVAVVIDELDARGTGGGEREARGEEGVTLHGASRGRKAAQGGQRKAKDMRRGVSA